MANILGISAYYHDSAAALLVDGRIVAAAQEERFSRQKHDAAFPAAAIEYCLREAALSQNDIDYVAFYEKPLLRMDRILETFLARAPRGFRSFRKAVGEWFLHKLDVKRDLSRSFPDCRAPIAYTEHHESHAASAYFPSPFVEAAILTLDGVGEWSTGAIGHGRANCIELLREMAFPHSIGLLYSAFTYYLGFKVNSGEYKVMGLAPYGQPRFRELITDHLVDLKEDGSLRMDMSYFDFAVGLKMTNSKFDRLFGGPRREPESKLTQRHMDLAASIQAVTEEAVLRSARTASELTGAQNLVMAGGVALNCAATAKVREHGPFRDVWIQPAAGDAGGSLGAALFVHHQLLSAPRSTSLADQMQSARLGPRFSDEQIRSDLVQAGAVFHTYSSSERDALIHDAVRALSSGSVIAWFQGRMEFGPRALGARSIFADPRDPRMRDKINAKIKLREAFRPFAPAVLREQASKWFDVSKNAELPYMTFLASSRRDLDLTNSFPAVIHVDGTARIQTVDAALHPLFHSLLTAFQQQTGCPMLVNTSFNIRGEPIVCSPADAYRCFMQTELDGLVIGNQILWKSEQPTGTTTLNTTSRLGSD